MEVAVRGGEQIYRRSWRIQQGIRFESLVDVTARGERPLRFDAMLFEVESQLQPLLLPILDGTSALSWLTVDVENDKLVERSKAWMTDLGDSTPIEMSRKALEGSKAVILLCREDYKFNSQRWLLVLWTPPGTSAARKLLYGAAHSQLLDFLSSSAVVDECVASSLEDFGEQRPVTSAMSNSSTCASPSVAGADPHDLSPNTSFEKEDELSSLGLVSGRRRSSWGKSGGGGKRGPAVVIQETSSFQDSIDAFKRGQRKCVELELDDSTSHCTAAGSDFTTLHQLADDLNMKEPRFYLIRYENATLFFVFCPEAAIRKSRFLYVAAKRWVLAAVQSRGVLVDCSFDLRWPADLQSIVPSLTHSLSAPKDEGDGTDLSALGQLSVIGSRPLPPSSLLER